jgi:hypothetical protein
VKHGSARSVLEHRSSRCLIAIALTTAFISLCTSCAEIRGSGRRALKHDAGAGTDAGETNTSTAADASADAATKPEATSTAPAEECQHQKLGVPFCDGEDRLRVCRDQTRAEVRDCGELERCVMVNDSARCACVAGASDQGLGCQYATSCGTQAGGCDPLTECTMRGSERVCGACPEGYLGSGESGCEPGWLG